MAAAKGGSSDRLAARPTAVGIRPNRGGRSDSFGGAPLRYPRTPGVATAAPATVSASSKVGENDSDDDSPPPSQESGRCGRAAAAASGQLRQAGQTGAGGGCGAGWGRRRGTSP